MSWSGQLEWWKIVHIIKLDNHVKPGQLIKPEKFPITWTGLSSASKSYILSTVQMFLRNSSGKIDVRTEIPSRGCSTHSDPQLYDIGCDWNAYMNLDILSSKMAIM